MSADDKYTYPGSGGVLINLRNITDGPTLDRLMNDYASAVWGRGSCQRRVGKHVCPYHG